MSKGLDLLLINSFASRHRIVSDASLENSLCLIRSYLEDKGFSVYTIDEQRITSIEHGVPRWLLKLLRVISQCQITASNSGYKIIALLLLMFSWPMHALSLYYRRKYMNTLMHNIANLVKNDQIPLIGLKLWYGEAYEWSLSLAEKIREVYPEAILIAGGPHVKVFGEHVLEKQRFDLAIMGPGEDILAKLIELRREAAGKQEFLEAVRQKISSGPLIKTGQFKAAEDMSASFFSVPKYSPADLKDKILFHTLVDGVGCSWNKCAFCSHTRQCLTYTPRPVELIRDEILEMTKQGIGFFRFSSSETPAYHGNAIARMLLDNDIKINYSMFVRAGKPTPETYDAYRLMIRSGLRAVFMGGETGHDLINSEIMNKGVTRKEIIDTIHCIKLASNDVGIPCRVGLSMIYPCPVLPSVTLDEVFQENTKLVQEALPDAVIINPPGLFPGTYWFDNAESLGFQKSSDYVSSIMAYEYSNYKPVEFWPRLDISLNGMSMLDMLKETGRLRRYVEDLGIPMGVSDELLMMIDAIGMTTELDRLEFRRNSLVDIMSGTSNYIKQITERINEHSRQLAFSNHKNRK